MKRSYLPVKDITNPDLRFPQGGRVVRCMHRPMLMFQDDAPSRTCIGTTLGTADQPHPSRRRVALKNIRHVSADDREGVEVQGPFEGKRGTRSRYSLLTKHQRSAQEIPQYGHILETAVSGGQPPWHRLGFK